MYEETGSDAHLRSYARILCNQAKFWEAAHPELAELGLNITPVTAELVCTIFSEHLKTFHPMARMVPLTAMYEHLLDSGQSDILGDGPREALARMQIARGLAGLALPYQKDGSPWIEQIQALMAEHARGLGRPVDAPQVPKSKRGYGLQMYWEAFPDLLKDKTVLHIGPELQVTEFFEKAQKTWGCVYRPVDGTRPGHMEHHDICELDIEDGVFDTVLCHHVFEHVVNDRKAMQEVHRVLKPGGVLNFSVPQSFYLEQTADWVIPDPNIHGHVRTYGRDLEQRVAEVGFEVARDEWLLHQPWDVMESARAKYMLLYNARKPDA